MTRKIRAAFFLRKNYLAAGQWPRTSQSSLSDITGQIEGTMPSKTFKSVERVEESDLDTDANSAQGTGGKSKRTSKITTDPTTKRKAAPANDNASAEKPAKRIKVNVPPSVNKKPADPKPKPREPTPSPSDSESSSADIAESEDEQTQETAVGVRKEEATTSASDSSSEEESDEEEKEKGQDGESEEDEDDDDTKSPSEEGSDEDMEDASPAVNAGSGAMFVDAINLSDESTADNGSSSDQVFETETELVDNVPPPGFKPLPATAKLSKREARFLSDKNLAGKQVFFIDTPDGISFEAIKSLKMDDITRGNVVTKQDKKEYSFVEEGASGHLLLAFQEGDEPTFAPGK